MKKIYVLSSCSTCNRILNELNRDNFDEIIDIKTNPITESELDKAKSKMGSYEALFNKRAIKFRPIKDSVNNDADFKKLILSDYTFLKRPLFVIEDNYIAGNSKSMVKQVKSLI